MISDARPPPMFVAGALGLDVLNTIGAPSGATIEWLGDGEDLLAWLEQAQLIPAEVAQLMRNHTPADRLDAIAAEARRLREWFRAFVITHKGEPTGVDALKQLSLLNEVLERDNAYGVIVASEPALSAGDSRREASGLSWRWERRWETPRALLLPIAQEMAHIVCDVGLTHVKQCEGQSCTMLYLDTTKGHARRWCSMAVCGNRAKQAAHRARARSGGATRIVATRT